MSEKRFSLPFRWTITLAGIVVVTMMVGLWAIYKFQQEATAELNVAMTALSFDYGHSLAQFIATENAESVLLEDWDEIQLIAKQIKDKRIIDSLIVTDYNDIVRGSTDANLLGEPYQQPNTAELLTVRGNTGIYMLATAAGNSVFQFALPIMFKDIEVGKLYLDLAQPPGPRTTDRTVLVLLTQMILLVIVIMVMGYVLHTRLIRPLRILERALSELANEHHEYRIDEQRQDLWGRLFALCNRTAEHLSKAEEKKIPPFTETSLSEAATLVTGDRQSPDTSEEETKVIGHELTKPSAPEPTISEARTRAIPAQVSYAQNSPARDTESDEATRVVEVDNSDQDHEMKNRGDKIE